MSHLPSYPFDKDKATERVKEFFDKLKVNSETTTTVKTSTRKSER